MVGGLSIEKQRRILNVKRPHIIVATPGRFWELIEEDCEFLKEISSKLQFFVVDETDRMIERGHFAELQSIVDHLKE